MSGIESYIQNSLPVAWIAITVAFFVLFKCADAFVDASVGLAERFHIPRLVIGIILVSLATTAPELAVSLTAALQGNPEMALGNAIGSVICDDGLAMGFAGLFAATPIAVIPVVLKSAGIFLIGIQIITFLFVFFDATLGRLEGCVLVLLFAGYIAYLFRQHKKGILHEETGMTDAHHKETVSIAKLMVLFFFSLAGIIIASRFVITSATTIALSFHISETVIAMTLVAFGTSIPEVATCISAARKGEGAIAVGNILGADIMNICWVAGASAIANSLTIAPKDLAFMFPSMFIIVGAMLCMLRAGYNLNRTKGAVLLGLYVCYLIAFFILFPPHS